MPVVNVRVVDTLVYETAVDGNESPQNAEWRLTFTAESGTSQEVELFVYEDDTVFPGDLTVHNDTPTRVDAGDFLDIRASGFELDAGVPNPDAPLPEVNLSINLATNPTGSRILPVEFPAGNPDFRYDFILEWG